MFDVIVCVRTIKQRLKLNKGQYKLVKHYCYHSRALYNSAIFICQEYFKETGQYIGYSDLYFEIKENFHYREIPAMISQQIIRLVDKNYRSFFALLKKKNSGQYADKIETPKFKKSGSEFILILDNTRVKLRKGELKITKDLIVPFSYEINGVIKQTVIKPRGGKYYEILISYEENKQDVKQLNENSFLSIDLGLNNLASCYSEKDCFIINGKPLKSYNHNYNKRKAKIQNELKKKNDKHWSNKLAQITNNRQSWVNNYMHQSTSIIVKYCVENNIGTIICGYNQTWKNGINLGKKTNQNFVSIPHKNFIDKLKTKCENIGIKFELQEESYTSKCSFLDNEEVCEHEKYKGSRTKRGLFQTENKTKVNADMNGAANIAKKYFGRDLQPNKGGIVTPVVFNPLNPTKLV